MLRVFLFGCILIVVFVIGISIGLFIPPINPSGYCPIQHSCNISVCRVCKRSIHEVRSSKCIEVDRMGGELLCLNHQPSQLNCSRWRCYIPGCLNSLDGCQMMRNRANPTDPRSNPWSLLHGTSL